MAVGRIIAALVLVVAHAGLAWAQSDSDLEERAERVASEMVQLFAECGPVGLIVSVNGGEHIALTREAVEVAARSRIRAARLWVDPPGTVWGILHVSVEIGNDENTAFVQRVAFGKRQLDVVSGIESWSPTGWSRGFFGVHGDDPNSILSSLSQSLDHFIDDYLRVNELSCREQTPAKSGSGPRLGPLLEEPFAQD